MFFNIQSAQIAVIYNPCRAHCAWLIEYLVKGLVVGGVKSIAVAREERIAVPKRIIRLILLVFISKISNFSTETFAIT